MDRGDVENAAVVTGLRDRTAGHRRRHQAVPAVTLPRDRLVKSAFPVTYGAAGEQDHLHLHGDQQRERTLHSVTLTDTGSARSAALTTTLAPGRATTCLGYHRTTQADVDAGQVVNAADRTSATRRPARR